MTIPAMWPHGGDPRSPCFCTWGCSDRSRPPFKYFATSTGAVLPFLSLVDGVLLTFFASDPVARECTWRWENPITPRSIYTIVRKGLEPNTHRAGWTFTADNPATGASYINEWETTTADCGLDQTAPACFACSDPDGLIPLEVELIALPWNCDLPPIAAFGQGRAIKDT